MGDILGVCWHKASTGSIKEHCSQLCWQGLKGMWIPQFQIAAMLPCLLQAPQPPQWELQLPAEEVLTKHAPQEPLGLTWARSHGRDGPGTDTHRTRCRSGPLSLFYLVWDVDRSRRVGQHCRKAESREAKELAFN